MQQGVQGGELDYRQGWRLLSKRPSVSGHPTHLGSACALGFGFADGLGTLYGVLLTDFDEDGLDLGITGGMSFILVRIVIGYHRYADALGCQPYRCHSCYSKVCPVLYATRRTEYS